MKKYFGQQGEDFLLWGLFDDGAPGYFVDVGAFDGIHLSNSYSFELEGWSGLCVEAHPEYFDLLRKNRPGSHAMHAACTGAGSDGEVVFLSEPLGLLSGIRADKTSNMEGRYAARGMKFPGFSPINVPCCPLDSILREINAPSAIGFLSIDTEGTELDVLRGVSLDRYSFRVIVVECNDVVDLPEMTGYLAGFGYELARSLDQNYFFTRSAEDRRILASRDIFCTVEGSEHPLGTHATHPGFRTRLLDINATP
jgi:FkbM family methyltransferase